MIDSLSLSLSLSLSRSLAHTHTTSAASLSTWPMRRATRCASTQHDTFINKAVKVFVYPIVCQVLCIWWSSWSLKGSKYATTNTLPSIASNLALSIFAFTTPFMPIVIMEPFMNRGIPVFACVYVREMKTRVPWYTEREGRRKRGSGRGREKSIVIWR